MCKLTEEQLEIVYKALEASVLLQNYDDAVEVLEMQDEAYEIVKKAINL